MKEVTICFSYSIKDGQVNNSSKSSSTQNGSSIDGDKSIENQRIVLREEYKLLELIHDKYDDPFIKCTTLSERKTVNSLDDLNTEIPTHAKGE